MTFKLSPNEARQAVASALRSDKYQQGDGALRIKFPGDDCSYCCLGVACDVFLLEEKKGKWIYDKYKQAWFFDIDNESNSDYLPLTVQKWLGFSDCKGTHQKDGDVWKEELYLLYTTNLARLNDDGCSFQEIAGWIEHPLEGMCS